MSSFSVQFDKSQIDEVRRLLAGVKNGAETSIRIGLNKGLDSAVSLSAKGINEKVTLTQSKIKGFFTKTRATNQTPSAVLRIRGESIPLINFSNRKLSRGISVKVWRDQGPDQFRHAFYATLRSGHVGIFMRRDFGAGMFAGRLPVDELRGPNVTSIYEKTPGLGAKVESESARKAIDELDRQVIRLMGA